MIAPQNKVVKKVAISSFSDEVATELPKVKKAIEQALGKSGSINVKKDTNKIKDDQDKKRKRVKKEKVYFFGFGDGMQTLIAENEGTLKITDVGKSYSLKDWNLWVTDLDVISLEGKVGKNVNLPVGIKRGVLMGPDGYRVDFCNVAKITLQGEVEELPKKIASDNLLLINVTDNAKGWLVAVESSNVINLNDVQSDVISVKPDSYGILVGPNANVLSFSHIRKIILPKIAEE